MLPAAVDRDERDLVGVAGAPVDEVEAEVVVLGRAEHEIAPRRFVVAHLGQIRGDGAHLRLVSNLIRAALRPALDVLRHAGLDVSPVLPASARVPFDGPHAGRESAM